jgi:hypothetical protein
MTDTWPHAKHIAKGIVSDWMHLEADERKMDILVKYIEEELDKAFTRGMRYGASDLAASLRARNPDQ